MLEKYTSTNTVSPQNWCSQDAALFFVTMIGSRESTPGHDTTKISEHVNLEEFTTMHVLPVLEHPNSKFKI